MEFDYVGSGRITTKGTSAIEVSCHDTEQFIFRLEVFLAGVSAEAVYNYYSSRLRG